MRERLIELINECDRNFEKTCPQHNRQLYDCASCKYDCGGTCDYTARKADYLLENGVVMLPCKVGDTVFDISDGTPYETRVINFAYFGDHWVCRTVSGFPDLADFGTRIFLTKEEAEKALEERNKAVK